ncbi:MAG TPA: hypothetical protein VFJ57_06530 [Solirubrobacterales bacterium]|nr:hypothetical protein [Solirubrobacterales bacterium]
MNGHRSVVGLCLLCALAFSAFAAQFAAAATNGTTAFTCKNEGPGHAFSKAHCAPADAVGGEYEHVAIPEGTSTQVVGTAGTTEGAKEVTKLKGTLAGVVVEIQAKGLDLEGTLTNSKAESGEHFVHGEGKVIYTEASVTAPAGKGCKVKGGKVETKQIVSTSAGQGDALNFTPASGTTFTEFAIEGCSISGLNHTFPVSGSVSGATDGATIKFTHAETTAQNTLKFGGQKTGIEGSITLNGRDPVLEETVFTPLSATTVETP